MSKKEIFSNIAMYRHACNKFSMIFIYLISKKSIKIFIVEGLRQVDSKFEMNLGNQMRCCLKTKTKIKGLRMH